MDAPSVFRIDLYRIPLSMMGANENDIPLRKNLIRNLKKVLFASDLSNNALAQTIQSSVGNNTDRKNMYKHLINTFDLSHVSVDSTKIKDCHALKNICQLIILSADDDIVDDFLDQNGIDKFTLRNLLVYCFTKYINLDKQDITFKFDDSKQLNRLLNHTEHFIAPWINLQHKINRAVDQWHADTVVCLKTSKKDVPENYILARVLIDKYRNDPDDLAYKLNQCYLHKQLKANCLALLGNSLNNVNLKQSILESQDAVDMLDSIRQYTDSGNKFITMYDGSVLSSDWEKLYIYLISCLQMDNNALYPTHMLYSAVIKDSNDIQMISDKLFSFQEKKLLVSKLYSCITQHQIGHHINKKSDLYNFINRHGLVNENKNDENGGGEDDIKRENICYALDCLDVNVLRRLDKKFCQYQNFNMLHRAAHKKSSTLRKKLDNTRMHENRIWDIVHGFI